ncbi:hypothetical protein T03_6802 [Trichinella britovi]|uniref:Uncharacterized protein n=1 Tax=Trichinella britovi TaxID=45882 RepID=A0A0V1D3H0_TRIBR|nr:hypothetical protein T03_6802 [Trichinella britovi]
MQTSITVHLIINLDYYHTLMLTAWSYFILFQSFMLISFTKQCDKISPRDKILLNNTLERTVTTFILTERSFVERAIESTLPMLLLLLLVALLLLLLLLLLLDWRLSTSSILQWMANAERLIQPGDPRRHRSYATTMRSDHW